MTTAEKREALSDLRDAVAEINDDLASAMDELKELHERIANLKADKAWRVEAIRFLKAPVTQ